LREVEGINIGFKTYSENSCSSLLFSTFFW
jgi:hypothetical protein